MAQMQKLYFQFQRIIDQRKPLSPFVRAVIAAAITMRLFLDFNYYYASIQKVWIGWLTIYWVYTVVLICLNLYIYFNQSFEISTPWYVFQIIFDALSFTLFYILTGRPYSDFYLFFFLPLLIAAEHLSGEFVLIVFLIVSVLFLGAIGFLNTSYVMYFFNATSYQQEQISTGILIIYNVIPRWFFFLVIVVIVFIRSSILKEISDELEAVQKTAMRISNNEAIEQRLESILDVAIDLLHARGCKVYLYSPNENILRLVALRGISSPLFRVGYTLHLDDGIAGKVFFEQKPKIENDYRNSPNHLPELAELFEAIVEVPLIFREPIGVIGVFDDRPRKFSDRDVFILQRLAQYASIAIHDSQIFEQSQKQSDILNSLYLASNSMINASFDINKTLASIAEHAWRLSITFNKTPPLFTYIALYDREKKFLEFSASYPANQLVDLRDRVGKIDVNQKPIGIIGRAIATGDDQNVSDVCQDIDYISYNLSTKSQLAVLAHGRRGIVGVISIEHPDLTAFPRELQEQMEVLAALAASAIENAMLYIEINSAREQSEKLRTAAIEISSSFGISDVGLIILKSLRKLIQFDRATIQLINTATSQRELVAKYNLSEASVSQYLLRPVSEDKLVQRIVENKSTLIIPSTKYNSDWEASDTTKDILSWAGIPLIYVDRIIGLITLDNIAQQAYTDENKNMLDLFSAHAAGAFQNAILYQQLTEKVNELLQTKESLETLLKYYDDYQNLALIGLVYGETIHYASDKLGMAKTIMKNIQIGDYEDITTISQKAERAVRYVNDYLTVLRDVQDKALQSPSLVPVDIHILLDKIIQSKRISFDIEVKKIYKIDKPVVSAPEHQLRQIFYVIIQNALDAMPSGEGILTINTSTKKLDTNEFLIVSITDTGKGIPLNEQQILFETKMINSDKKHRRGSGMGLVWARSFIRSYGGDIYYRTFIGKGTTIFVRIPRDFGIPLTGRGTRDQ